MQRIKLLRLWMFDMSPPGVTAGRVFYVRTPFNRCSSSGGLTRACNILTIAQTEGLLQDTPSHFLNQLHRREFDSIR